MQGVVVDGSMPASREECRLLPALLNLLVNVTDCRTSSDAHNVEPPLSHPAMDKTNRQNIGEYRVSGGTQNGKAMMAAARDVTYHGMLKAAQARISSDTGPTN